MCRQHPEEAPALVSRRESTFLATGVALLMLLVLQTDTNRSRQPITRALVVATNLRASSLPLSTKAEASGREPCFRNGQLFFASGGPWNKSVNNNGGPKTLKVGARSWLPTEESG